MSRDLLTELLVRPGDWVKRAACRGTSPDLFFPTRGESTAEAKAVCADCHVRTQCLDYALTNCEKFGVWGGLSERERRRIRKQRRIETIAA